VCFPICTFKYAKSSINGVVANKLERWECAVCGYIYDPEVGDPESGVKAGTPFERLPENWVCPVCGATRDQFIKK